MEQKPLVFSTEPKNALDKMQFFQGQRAGRELWNDKPTNVQDEDLATFDRDIDSVRDYIISLEKEVMNLRNQRAQLRELISTLSKDKSEIERQALEEVFSELITYAEAEHLMGLPNPRKGSLPTGMIKILAEKRGITL
jgi:hypothetical protein